MTDSSHELNYSNDNEMLLRDLALAYLLKNKLKYISQGR